MNKNIETNSEHASDSPPSKPKKVISGVKKFLRYSIYTIIALLVIGYVLLRVVARDYNLISKMGEGAILEVYMDNVSDRSISKTEALRVTRWLKENKHPQAQSDFLKKNIQQGKASAWRKNYLYMIQSVIKDSPKVTNESELKAVQVRIKNHVSNPYFFGAPSIMIEQGGIKPEDYIKKMEQSFDSEAYSMYLPDLLTSLEEMETPEGWYAFFAWADGVVKAFKEPKGALVLLVSMAIYFISFCADLFKLTGSRILQALHLISLFSVLCLPLFAFVFCVELSRANGDFFGLWRKHWDTEIDGVFSFFAVLSYPACLNFASCLMLAEFRESMKSGWIFRK